MGMAASQARYLALTARKSTVEFQAQQINQQRTQIANELSGTFRDLVDVKVPTVPNELDYQEVLYKCDMSNTISGSTNKYSFSKFQMDEYGVGHVTLNRLDGTGSILATENVSASFTKDSQGSYVQSITITEPDNEKLAALDLYTNAQNDDVMSKTIQTNEEAYQQAYAAYTNEKSKYDKRISEINAKTAELQKQDSTLELRLRQLDTEQNSIQTELESVKKVIEDTIEKVFTTFKS